jgi:hypothetical protein
MSLQVSSIVLQESPLTRRRAFEVKYGLPENGEEC